MRIRPAAALPFLALALALPAPAGQNAKQVREAPMDFDPAKPERIEGWWSNGQELMRLDPNGAYRMWLTQDRFKRPVEVGAWRRTNYVFFDLEPYRAKPGTRIRVNLQKDAGLTELVREGMADFRWLPGPPHVIADDMLGAWVSPSEQLLILDSGRYGGAGRSRPPASPSTRASGTQTTTCWCSGPTRPPSTPSACGSCARRRERSRWRAPPDG